MSRKTLRWFLHHHQNSYYKENYNFTKRLIDSAIKAGLVFVNNKIALDSSSILNCEDKVNVFMKKNRKNVIRKTTTSKGNNNRSKNGSKTL